MLKTGELADFLLESSPEHEGWSIVESPNASDQYERLLEWAGEHTLHSWKMDYAIRKRHLGLVLLWLESEVARRHGGEGSLWPKLSDQNLVPWNDWVYEELFTPGGHATSKHRSLLQHTAEYYSMRHTFGTEDGQNWYRLIYLQFGFTHDDAEHRLAAWLSGQILPVSVQKLLESNDPGALAFQKLWRSLRMFRLGNLARGTIEAIFHSNPWVLPEWTSDLLEAARRSSAQILEIADLEASEVKFFTAPRLVVPENGPPYFTTSLCNLDQLDLTAEAYELRAGENALARLIRQEDGSYYSDTPEAIVLPTQPTVPLSLVDNHEAIEQHDEAILWDPMEEVTVYSQRTGGMILPGVRLRTGTAVNLISSEDVAIVPKPFDSIDLGLGYSLQCIALGWTGQLQALLDGDVIWTSWSQIQAVQEQGQEVTAYFTQTLDLCTDESDTPKPPWSLPIHFNIPSGWKVTRLRWTRQGGDRIEFSELPSHLTLTEADAVRPVVLRVRITNGSLSKTQALRIRVSLVATIKWTRKGNPYHHPKDRKLILGEARQLTWSFSLPTKSTGPTDPRTCSFMEGTLHHGRLKARPSALPNLAGFGAPLHIVEDPFRDEPSIMRVAPCVLDGGVLGSAVWNSEEEAFHIKSTFTGTGPDHQITVWFTDHENASRVETIPIDTLELLDDGWLWFTPTKIQLHAILFSFRGKRLGSWFDFRWSHCLTRNLPGSVSEVAGLLRAWKAPFLQVDDGNLDRVSTWFAENWSEILPVWLSEDSVPGPFSMKWSVPSRVSEGWGTVMRTLLMESFPVLDDENAGILVDTLAPSLNGAQAIGTALFKMAEACPILAARVARIYLEEFVSVRDKKSFLQMFLALSDFEVSDEKAEEIARRHGNLDGSWVMNHAIPDLHSLEQNGASAIPHAYRFLSNSKDFRLFALGKWLAEIR